MSATAAPLDAPGGLVARLAAWRPAYDAATGKHTVTTTVVQDGDEVARSEVSTPDELTQDSIAYLDVSLAPRNQGEPRQIFRGWMFASSPSVNGLQHPIYDAWVVGCKG